MTEDDHDDEEIKQDEQDYQIENKTTGATSKSALVDNFSHNKKTSADKMESHANIVTATSPDTKRKLLEEKQNKDDKPRCDATLAELPLWMHDNEFLETGYRINYKTCTQVTGSMC